MIKKDELQDKFKDFELLLLGMNAYGSLNLTELRIIINYLKGSFGCIPLDEFEFNDDLDSDIKN